MLTVRDLLLGDGLSPRLRGNPPDTRPSPPFCRSIPAPAGEPAPPAGLIADWWVYPRACGGTNADHAGNSYYDGLSPRLRGNPLKTSAATGGSTVYPRACGGTSVSPLGYRLRMGLSPRLRGNPDLHAGGACRWRSIPAPAGEPAPRRCGTSIVTVYPRACGGTSQECHFVTSTVGLSPRLRGNPCRRAPSSSMMGSIPAPAGEPACGTTCWGYSEVYPRACGGTWPLVYEYWDDWGLSPRLRGNLIVQWLALGQSVVYPRACGGTGQSSWDDAKTAGLSPRLRGNPKRPGRQRPR